MLSVAQAVRHPETPGSASKHSSLVNPWSSERPNVLKRRKTEPADCYNVHKKLTKYDEKNCIETRFPDITLTKISKNNDQSQFKELFEGKIKTPVSVEKEEITCVVQIEQEKDEIKPASTDFSSIYSLLENSKEIVLTRIGTNENIKLVNQSESHDNCSKEVVSDTNLEDKACKITEPEEKSSITSTNSILELREVTIEQCSNHNKTKVTKSPSSPKESKLKKPTKTQLKIYKAQERLQVKDQSVKKSVVTENVTDNTDASPRITQAEADQIFNFDDGNVSEQNVNYIESNPHLFDDITDNHPSTSATVSDYEPFNVGTSCEDFYINNKCKPHYATGFPNPPAENRCWINATLQALFTLPIMSKLDSLDNSKCSKLINSLMSIQNFWKKGTTRNCAFTQSFHTFKEELSVLDKVYSSKAQQDVSEFIMSLLNFVKTEFETLLEKESHHSEIENIPNNDQTALRKLQNNMQDSNKRSPLADISAKQSRNNFPVTCSSQQDDSSTKINSAKTSSDDEVEANINPVDECFSMYIVENYVCENCSKQRQQKTENLMMFIDLPSEDYGTHIDLVDIINSTYAAEHRDMTCESCKHNKHKMVTKFRKLPKILTVHLNRYNVNNELNVIVKKTNPITIPQSLKLESLMMNNQDSNHIPEYEPIGIISHIGDYTDSGHYISFVKHQNQWFYYDDLNVKILSEEEVFKCVQNNAYVIFFQDTTDSSNISNISDQKNKKDNSNFKVKLNNID